MLIYLTDHQVAKIVKIERGLLARRTPQTPCEVSHDPCEAAQPTPSSPPPQGSGSEPPGGLNPRSENQTATDSPNMVFGAASKFCASQEMYKKRNSPKPDPGEIAATLSNPASESSRGKTSNHRDLSKSAPTRNPPHVPRGSFRTGTDRPPSSCTWPPPSGRGRRTTRLGRPGRSPELDPGNCKVSGGVLLAGALFKHFLFGAKEGGPKNWRPAGGNCG